MGTYRPWGAYRDPMCLQHCSAPRFACSQLLHPPCCADEGPGGRLWPSPTRSALFSSQLRSSSFMEGAIGQFLLHTRKQNTAQVSRAVQCTGEGGDCSGRQPRAQGEGGCDAKSCCRDWDRASTGGAPPTCQPQQHLCCQEGPEADPACMQTVWSQASVCASKQGPNPAKAHSVGQHCTIDYTAF